MDFFLRAELGLLLVTGAAGLVGVLMMVADMMLTGVGVVSLGILGLLRD